ncbi:MAG: hypothetical protein KKG60_02130 [Nanoarchaeota archaeon]|nr:hypothetical protein [Nanoarchaeota archaeon]
MTDLVFDSSSIISISLNNLLNIMAELKKHSEVEFLIPKSVKKEIMDTPLKSRKFKLEAIMLSSMIGSTFKLFDSTNIQKKAIHLQNLANSIFTANGRLIKLVDLAEMEGLALAIFLKVPYVVDERTTRLLVENPKNLHIILSRKFDTEVSQNQQALNNFLNETKGTTIIRSVELMTIAYEKGLFDSYKNKNVPGDFGKQILEAILWGLRLKGCSISTDEIYEIIRLEQH